MLVQFEASSTVSSAINIRLFLFKKKFLASYSKSVYNLIIKLKENTHGKLVRALNYYFKRKYMYLTSSYQEIKEIGGREDTFYGRGL